jgi:hypothetical protein
MIYYKFNVFNIAFQCYYATEIYTIWKARCIKTLMIGSSLEQNSTTVDVEYTQAFRVGLRIYGH